MVLRMRAREKPLMKADDKNDEQGAIGLSIHIVIHRVVCRIARMTLTIQYS